MDICPQSSTFPQNIAWTLAFMGPLCAGPSAGQTTYDLADRLDLLPTPRELRLDGAEHALRGWEIVVPDDAPLLTAFGAVLKAHIRFEERVWFDALQDALGKRRLEALHERMHARLPDAHKALRSPEHYTVEHSSALDDLQRRVTQSVAQHELGE